MQSIYYFILVPMVYIAFRVFIIGTSIRLFIIFNAPKHSATLKLYPEKKTKLLGTIWDALLFPAVLRHKPLLWFFLVVFHGGLVLLIIGHLELIWDLSLFQVIPHEPFLGKGFVGLALVVAVLFFLFRRLKDPVKSLSVPEDYYLLILLFIIILLGSQMDWARRWYEYGELTVEDYREYLTSLIVLKPELPYNATFSGHSFMLILHVLFANLFLIFFPFSQSIHSFLSIPVNKLKRGI